MEIKLTDKQFKQLQTELIKDAFQRTEARKTSKKKFIDVVIYEHPQNTDSQGVTRQVSICVDSIISIEGVDDHPNFKSTIFTILSKCPHKPAYCCISSVDELKQMIKEAENND